MGQEALINKKKGWNGQRSMIVTWLLAMATAVMEMGGDGPAVGDQV